MGKEWIKLKETGQLFLEKVLVSFNIPILFVCVDYEKNKYLCLNIDEETGESVIIATDNEHLLKMLKNEVTMESVFRDTNDQKVIVAKYDFEEQKIISHIENSKTISKDMLPKQNEYFEFTNEAIKEYISYLEKQIIKIQIETFSDKAMIVIQKNVPVPKFATKDLMNLTCEKMIITEAKYKCSYNLKNENRMIA